MVSVSRLVNLVEYLSGDRCGVSIGISAFRNAYIETDCSMVFVLDLRKPIVLVSGMTKRMFLSMYVHRCFYSIVYVSYCLFIYGKSKFICVGSDRTNWTQVGVFSTDSHDSQVMHLIRWLRLVLIGLGEVYFVTLYILLRKVRILILYI